MEVEKASWRRSALIATAVVVMVLIGSVVFLEVLSSGRAPTPSVEVGLVFGYILVLAAFATLPVVWDLQKSYRSRREAESGQIDKLIDAAAKDGLTGEELRVLVQEIRAPPPGLPGLGRQTMALAILVLLGIVVFHALVFGVPDASKDIVKSVADVLGGAVSAIIGFYYGAKKVEEKTEEAKGGQAPKAAMTARVTASPTSGRKPLLVEFSVAISEGDSPFTAKWDFDDGGAGDGLALKHTYDRAGTFTASVKVRDRQGKVALDGVVIEVSEEK